MKRPMRWQPGCFTLASRILPISRIRVTDQKASGLIRTAVKEADRAILKMMDSYYN